VRYVLEAFACVRYVDDAFACVRYVLEAVDESKYGASAEVVI
jgi:hypothetical protein